MPVSIDEVKKVYVQLWDFTKKYLPQCTSPDESVWDAIRDDCTRIYNSTEDMPEYFRDMTSKMIVAAADLLEDIYREEHKNESKR